MMKRMFAILLALILVISAMPVVAADNSVQENGTENAPYLISNLDELKAFLSGASAHKDTVWYSLDSDIIATDKTKEDITGGYDVNNVILDGNGHKISGFSMTDALFGNISNSSVRNIVFENITVTTVNSHCAVLAQTLEDYTAFITGCTFVNCDVTVKSTEKDVYAGIVTAENNGTIVSCTIDSNCSVTADCAEARLRLGGVVGYNDEYGYIISCLTEAVLTAKAYKTKTEGEVIGDSDSNANANGCVHKKNGKYYIDGKEYTDSVYILAAELSQISSAYNDDAAFTFEPPVAVKDFAKLWTVDSNGNIAVAFDEKTAQVFLSIDKTFYNKEKIQSFSLSFSDNVRSVAAKKDNNNVSVYSVAVGYYNGNTYVRNTVTVSCVCVKEYEVINSFVLAPEYNYVTKCTDVFGAGGNNYAVKPYFPDHTTREQTSAVDIAPFCASLSLKSSAADDQIVNYSFPEGSGTADDPFLIGSDYELRVLSSLVNNGIVGKDPNVYYNQAYYALKNDIKMSADNFTPIGIESNDGSTAFRGSFNGNGCTISGLRICSTIKGQGLFGIVKGIENSTGGYERYAEIKNLNVVDAKITDDINLSANRAQIKGILVGQAEGAIINGCVTNGSVEGNTQIGGVVGYAYMSKIYNCGSTANVTAYSANARAGGIAAYVQHSAVGNGYFAGSISVPGMIKEEFLSLGGVAGYIVDSTFENTYYRTGSAGNAPTVVTGISEKLESELKSSAFLDNLVSYSLEKRLGIQWVSDGKNINSRYPVIFGSVEKEYMVKSIITGEGMLRPEKVRYKAGETVWVSCNPVYVYEIEPVGIKITDFLMNPLDVSVEKITIGGVNYYRFNMPTCDIRITPVYDMDTFEGLGTKEDPFVISSLNGLKHAIDLANVGYTYDYIDCETGEKVLNTYYKSSFALGADIDCKGETMSPFCQLNVFTGNFDGKGYTISNCNIESKYSDVGFFGRVNGASICNMQFENINVSGTENAAIVAGYAADDYYFTNISVENCTVSSASNASVIVADASNSDELCIINCNIRGITFNDCSSSSILVGAYGYYIANPSIYNCVVCDINGDVNRFFGVGATNNWSYGNNYYDSGFSLEDTRVLATGKTPDEINSDSFIAEMSYYAETKLSNYDLYLWGKDESGRADIMMNNINATSKIILDPVFKEYENIVELLKVNTVPSLANVGDNISIKYKLTTGISDLRIISQKGDVSYFVNNENDGNGYGTISFTMPDGYVQIDNNGQIPAVQLLEGKGTEEEPYLIKTPYDLLHFAQVINGTTIQYKPEKDYVDYDEAYVEITNDLDMRGMPWIGIGTSRGTGADLTVYSFNGTFDGNFHTISNLNIDNGAADGNRIGLFGVTGKESTVKNFILSNSQIWESSKGCGAIAKENNGTIESCMVIGSFVSLGDHRGLGGIVGINQEGGIINNCAVVDTTIQRRWNGTSSQTMGGIAQDNNGQIYNCFTYNCTYSNGTSNNGIIISNESSNKSSAVGNCYYYYTGSNATNNIQTAKATGKDVFSSGKVAHSLNYGDYDEDVAWFQNLDNGLPPDPYPVLKYNGLNPVYFYNAKYTNFKIKEIYEISNPDELMTFSAYVNTGHYTANAIVVADIDMTGYDNYTPIGQTGLYYKADPAEGESKGYCGNFDGQGYVISNLSLKGSAEKDLSYGLFGTVSGTVKNIGVENFSFKGAGKDSRVGAVAGQLLKGGSLTDCYAKGVDINTQVNTKNGVAGGVAGANYAGEINNCYAYNASIQAGRTGGIVADNFGDANNSDGTDRPGKVTNCYTDYSTVCGRGTSTDSLANVSENTFKSGEITCKLDNGRDTSLWRQGTDKLPALRGDKIYKNLCKDEVFYSTVDGDFEHHDIDHEHGEVRCKRCNHFDSATLITDENCKSLGLTSSYIGMYAIENASNMYWINEQNAKSAVQNGVVLLEDITINNAVEPWTPMIVDGNFTFDGNGHTLTLNLDFGNTASSANMALFSTYNYAFVRDLVIKGSVKANTTGRVGGFASSMYRSTVERVISYADVTNNCTTGGTAGGIAGYYGGQMDSSNGCYSRILNSAVYADVKGYYAGGIVGYGWGGYQYYDIKNSAFVGDVTGINAQGAIIGYHANYQNAHECTFKDIYYLEKDGLAFSGGGNTNYTLDSTVAEKSKAEFASGEVAYLLNNGKTDGAIWKQNIDNGKAKDALPLHTGGTVYKNTTCIDEFIEYSNTADDVVHDYNNYCVCKKCIGLEPGEIAGIYGFDLSLAESISLNYYMVIDEKTAADPTAKMVFTVPDGNKENPDDTYTVTIPVSEAEHDDTFYYFTCGVPAKEMGSDIYCQIVTDTSESRNFRYSIKEYAEYILANPDNFEDEIPLVKAMLNYGGYTQIDLEHKTDDLANTSQYITEEEKILPDVDFLPYSYIIRGEQKGVYYYGASLSLLSETAINLYFYFESDEDAARLDITVDGNKVTPVKNKDYYEIKIPGVPAHMIHCYHIVKVGSLTLYYSVFSYAAIVQKENNNPVLLDVCKAIYVYNTEAFKYHSK